MATIKLTNQRRGQVDVNSNRIIGVSDGTGTNDAVNFGQLQATVSGLDANSFVTGGSVSGGILTLNGNDGFTTVMISGFNTDDQTGASLNPGARTIPTTNGTRRVASQTNSETVQANELAINFAGPNAGTLNIIDTDLQAALDLEEGTTRTDLQLTITYFLDNTHTATYALGDVTVGTDAQGIVAIIDLPTAIFIAAPIATDDDLFRSLADLRNAAVSQPVAGTMVIVTSSDPDDQEVAPDAFIDSGLTTTIGPGATPNGVVSSVDITAPNFLGNASTADQVDINLTNGNDANHFVPFSEGTLDGPHTLEGDGGLLYNPNSNRLQVGSDASTGSIFVESQTGSTTITAGDFSGTIDEFNNSIVNPESLLVAFTTISIQSGLVILGTGIDGEPARVGFQEGSTYFFTLDTAANGFAAGDYIGTVNGGGVGNRSIAFNTVRSVTNRFLSPGTVDISTTVNNIGRTGRIYNVSFNIENAFIPVDTLSHRVDTNELELSGAVQPNEITTTTTTTTTIRNGANTFGAVFTGYSGTFGNGTLNIQRSTAFPAAVNALVRGNILANNDALVAAAELSFVGRTERIGTHHISFTAHNAAATTLINNNLTSGFINTLSNAQVGNVLRNMQLLVEDTMEMDVVTPGPTTLVESSGAGLLDRRNIRTAVTQEGQTDAADDIPTVGWIEAQDFGTGDGLTFRYDVSTGDTLAFEEQTEASLASPTLDVQTAVLHAVGAGDLRVDRITQNVVGSTFVNDGTTFIIISQEDTAGNITTLNFSGTITVAIPDNTVVTLTLAEPTEDELIGTVSNVVTVAGGTGQFVSQGNSVYNINLAGVPNSADIISDFTAPGQNGPNRLVVIPSNKDVRFIGELTDINVTDGLQVRLWTRQDNSGQTTIDSDLTSAETLTLTSADGTTSFVIGTDSFILSELVDVRDASVVSDFRLTAAITNDQFVTGSLAVGQSINLQPVDARTGNNQNILSYDIGIQQNMRLINRANLFELRGYVSTIGTEYSFDIASIHNLPSPSVTTTGFWDFVPETYFSGLNPGSVRAADTSEPFNVSFTIPQLTAIGLTYTPLATEDDDTIAYDVLDTIPSGETFTIGQDTATVANGSNEAAILNRYLTDANGLSSAGVGSDASTVTNGTGGAGALLEFIVGGEIAGLFFTHEPSSDVWTMNNGFAPAPNGINIPGDTQYRLRYFDQSVPVFNNSGRVPFEGSDAELDAILLGYNGVASPVDGTRYLPLVANAELTSAYVDTNEVAVTTVVESITKRRDAFGPFLDLELNQSYRDQGGNRSNLYEPLIDTNTRSISLQLVSKVLNSDLYTEGNAAGTINIDGLEVRVPGTLDGSERFETDLAGDVSFVQHNPLAGFQDGFRITYTDNTTNSGTKSSVVEIPGIQSNRDRIRALEGGGDAHSHTSEAFGSFPYPGSVSGTFADGDLVGNADGFNFSTVNPVWSSLMTVTDAAQAHIDAGRTFSTGTASQTLATPLSLRFIIGARTKVQGGSFPWLGTSIRPGEFNLRAGQNLITGDTSDPARELFLALENSFLWGYTADTATYRNSLSFAANDNVNAGAPGLTFGVTPTQRSPLTQFIGNGEYRQDVVVSFVGFNGVEEEFNLGLTRVVHYTGPILAQDNTTIVNVPDTGAGASTRGEYLSHQASASHYVITNGTVPKGINLGRLDAQMFWLYPIIQDPATRSSSQFTRRVVNYSGGAQTVGIENRYGNPNNPDIGNELRFYLPDDELNEIYGQDGRLTQTFQFPGIARTDIQSGLGTGVNGFARDITLDFQSIDPTDSTAVEEPIIGNNDFQFSDGGASLQSRLTGSGITITYIGTSDPMDLNFGRQFRVQVQTFDTGIPNFQFIARYNNADQRSGWIGIDQNRPDSVLSVGYTPRFFIDGSPNAMGETRVSNLLRRDDPAETFIFDGVTGDLLPVDQYPTEAEYATSQVTVGTIDYGSGRETSYIDFRLPTVGAIPYVNGTNIGPQLGTSSVITELWQSSLGGSVNLHTLSGRRDTTTYPLSIDASWLYNQRMDDPNDLTLTVPADGSVLHYNDGVLSWDVDDTGAVINAINTSTEGITIAEGRISSEITRDSEAITEWNDATTYDIGEKVYIEQAANGTVTGMYFYNAIQSSTNSNPTTSGSDADWLPIGDSNSTSFVFDGGFYEVNTIVRFPSSGDPGAADAGANRYYRVINRDGATISSTTSNGIRAILAGASFELLFEAGASAGDNNQTIRTVLPITGAETATAGNVVLDINNFGTSTTEVNLKGTVPGPSNQEVLDGTFLGANGQWLHPLDPFTSPITGDAFGNPTELDLVNDTGANTFTVTINTGLQWSVGQLIAFSFNHGVSPIETAVLGGTVDAYDDTTGQLTVRGPWQFVSDTSQVRLNSWSNVMFDTDPDQNVFQLGAQGPRGLTGGSGAQGIGITDVDDNFASTLPGDPVTVMLERTDPANPADVLTTLDFTVQPGAIGKDGPQGARGFIGPFAVSLYAELAGVATNFAQTDVTTTYPIPTNVTFSSIRNELEGLNITDQPPGADAELNGDWSTQRPAAINNDIFVIEVVVTQVDDTGVDDDDYVVGGFSGVFRAAAQGPAGSQGPIGIMGNDGRDPELNVKITQSATAGITLINPSDPDGGTPDAGDFPLEFRDTLRITNSVNGDTGRDVTGTVTLATDFQGDNRILIQGNAVRTAGTDSTPTFWDVFVVAVQDTIDDVLDNGRSMQLAVAGIRGLAGAAGTSANVDELFVTPRDITNPDRANPIHSTYLGNKTDRFLGTPVTTGFTASQEVVTGTTSTVSRFDTRGFAWYFFTGIQFNADETFSAGGGLWSTQADLTITVELDTIIENLIG